MVLLSEGSSVKESPVDKQASAPCVRGSAKISRRVTLALYTGKQEIKQATVFGGHHIVTELDDNQPVSCRGLNPIHQICEGVKQSIQLACFQCPNSKEIS